MSTDQNNARMTIDSQLNDAWKLISDAVDQLRVVRGNKPIARLHVAMREIEKARDEIEGATP